MKTLYLLRHAKSSWGDPSLSDFQRPLNPRRLDAAPFMGALMRERALRVDTIISSPAVRALATAELVRSEMGHTQEITLDARVYDASVEELLRIISEIGDGYDSALLVGHNPGLEDTARYLTNQIFAMPTASLAIIDLQIDRWAEIATGSGVIRGLIRPRDEMKRAGLQ
ncbi:MAG: histidine phosphatase family protein [Blastocatellia bacterium]|nr:histidine phosphatase family protein [Blastocatellia bacterium]